MKTLQLLNIFCYISVFQTLLISFFLFVKKRGSTLNKGLIVSLLIIWSIFITGSYLLLTPKLEIVYYDLGHLMNLTIFLVAPLLYIYFKSLFTPQYRLSSKELYHIIPFIIISTILLNEIIAHNARKVVFYPTGIFLISFLFIQNIFYFYLIIKELSLVTNENGNKSKLKLFNFFLKCAFVIFTLKLLIFVTWNVLQYNEICIFLTGVFFALSFIITNAVVLFSLNNPELIIGAFKYQNSEISLEELATYMNQISSYLSEAKVYTNSLITLEKLAKNLKIQEKLLSQIINQATGLNFNDYINKYRVVYAQELMKNDDYKKILEVAYEAGFNSKTTFNSAFKKFTGLTPSLYRKSISCSKVA
jgi:AraC-like DNA-binding protein